MSLSTIHLGSSGFCLDVLLHESEEDFIKSYHGRFRRVGEDTAYPTLYWQIVDVPAGVELIGNIGFALDVDGATEPFTSLYDILRGVYREQVAKALGVAPSDISHKLLVLNSLITEDSESIDDNIVALAVKEIERTQVFDIGLTGYFYEASEAEYFASLLIRDGFEKLDYDGFVRSDAVMIFRPQLAYR